MAKLQIKGAFSTEKQNLETVLSLISFIEDGVHIIYAPALDLSASGTSLEDAKNSFNVAIEEFFRYTLTKKTLFKELKKLGWNVKGGKKNCKISSPNMSEMLADNEELEDIFSNKDFHKFNTKVQIPTYA